MALEDKNRTSQGDNFDGQLIYGIHEGVKSADYSFGAMSLKGEGVEFASPVDWSVSYPPVLFLGKSQQNPVTLRVGGGSLAGAITDEIYFQSLKDNGPPMENNCTGLRFDERNELAPMLDANQRDILDIIYDGRIRIIVLLNSLGGDVPIGENIIRLFNHVRGNGGSVDAYVSSVAASMAAGIFESADNRFVLDDSVMMWHAARPNLDSPFAPLAEEMLGPADTPEKRAKAIEAHRKSFSDFVARVTTREKCDKLMAALKKEWITNGSNCLGEFWLSGRQLSDYRIATRTFGDLESMERFFSKRTCLDPDALFKEDGYLDRFFSVSVFEEQIRRLCGLSVKVETGDHGWDIVGIFAKESDTFSIRNLTRDEVIKIRDCVHRIPNYASLCSAGHNLRVARRGQ